VIPARHTQPHWIGHNDLPEGIAQAKALKNDTVFSVLPQNVAFIAIVSIHDVHIALLVYLNFPETAQMGICRVAWIGDLWIVVKLLDTITGVTLREFRRCQVGCAQIGYHHDGNHIDGVSVIGIKGHIPDGPTIGPLTVIVDPYAYICMFAIARLRFAVWH
jgi:hypothetical protein